ncbi:polyphosphate--glucose phosphotransferase [Nonomuraea sp. ATR24]|uniref:polyphosphate--glucose phosphotransferase n=1 Tax=Nonomuraea TaxID=83681 RepID=UPI001C5E04CB|nr:ROK family protein [Nonomuraea ceibae]
MDVLGIDIGGSGIKGAPVDLETGELTRERLRVPTPRPAVPGAVAAEVGRIVEHFAWTGPVGVAVPGVVHGGVMRDAVNLHESWAGADAAELFGGAAVVNDADAAGLAEMTYGKGRGERGTVLMLTFGTGIGSALFVDGVLVPNTELGHLELHGHDAEHRASDRAREEHDLGWREWAGRVQDYLEHVVMLLSPSLIIIGGGVSKKADKFLPYVQVGVPVIPAALRNEAGIVGAAATAGNRRSTALP